jgi:glycosyltransferase involved in cell wall biosynthesis
MKILFFLGFRNPFPGAAWTRIKLIAHYLSDQKNTVDIIGAFMLIKTTNYKVNAQDPKSQNQIRLYNSVLTLGLSYRIPLAFVVNFISSFVFSIPWLLIKKPKLVVASLPPGDAGLGFVMASLLLKKNLIIDHRDEWDEECYVASATSSKIVNKFYKSGIKRILNSFYYRALAVTTVTQSFQKSLQKRGIKNVFLIPNGADTSTFKPLNEKVPRGEFRIIYLGWMGNYYSFSELIEALSLLRIKGIEDVKVTLVGEGTKLSSTLALASKLGVNDCIEYKGVVIGEQLVEVIAEADLGVIPGLYSKGQLPVKFFEYCACGVPVVAMASEDSELAGLIHKNEIGLTCRPHDVEGLSRAIERMYLDKSYRADAGLRARLLIEKRFDRNKINADFFCLIQELVRDT